MFKPHPPNLQHIAAAGDTWGKTLQRIDLRDSWVTEPPHNGPQMQEL